MKVWLHDHRPGFSNMVATLERGMIEDLCGQQQLDVVSEEEKYDADLWFVHLDVDDIRKIINREKGYEEFTGNQVIVFLTTQSGYPERRPYLSDILDIKEKKRAVLFVRKMEILFNDTVILEKILRLSYEDAEKLIAEGSSSILGWHSDPFYIISHVLVPVLAILCQGYLAVHAEYAGSGKDWNEKDLRAALEKMGWYALKEGHSRFLVPNNLASKIDTVRKADWWLGAFDVFDEKAEQKKEIVEEKWAAFENKLKREWEGLEEFKMPAEVEGFVHSLHDQRSVDRPEWVAKVYCAVAERLGGQPCTT
ncbi:MAG: hypothetical protein ISS63_07530 [Desulfobacteraceae bacterium]|nr:hypothetical protein [Desulfobacteraceae bacterium]